MDRRHHHHQVLAETPGGVTQSRGKPVRFFQVFTRNKWKKKKREKEVDIFVILPWVSAFDTAANKAKATPTTTSVGQPAMKENLLERIFGLDVKKMWAKPPRRHNGKTSFSGEFLFVSLFSLSPHLFNFYFPTASEWESHSMGQRWTYMYQPFLVDFFQHTFSLLLLPRGAKYPVTK